MKQKHNLAKIEWSLVG